jgi:hypothetical protein
MMAPKPYELRNLVRGAAAAERIRRQMAKTGKSPNGCPLWTEKELATCGEFFPDFKAIKRRLRRRSLVAVQQKCRDLGLSQQRNAWTGADIAKLRKLYPSATHDELRTAFPNHPLSSIKTAANKRGIFRVKKPYVPTGHPLLDEVRARCYELKLTMPDLDAMSGTKQYFRQSGWNSNRKAHPAMVRAVVALAGTMKVEWEAE